MNGYSTNRQPGVYAADMQAPDNHAARYSFLGTLFLVLPALIALQVFSIQIRPAQSQKIAEESVQYEWVYQTIIPARGQIFDRWGNLLTGNVTVYEVGVELAQVENPQTIAQTLNVVLGIDYATVLGIASYPASDTAVYAVVTDNVTQEQIDKLAIVIEQMDDKYGASEDPNAPSLSGLVFKPHLSRTYPEKTLASNIVGFVGGERKGFFGVEGKFNDLLAGKTKTIRVPVSPLEIPNKPETPTGSSLILAMDRTIQRAMEDVLDEALDDTGAQSGTIIVMNPKNGEVLAMATTPRLNPNEYWRYTEIFHADDSGQDTPFNRAVSQAYEPGSVFKVLTMAAALDAGVVTPDTIYLDQGVIEVHGLLIYNWDMGAWGPQSMQGCMQHSLNVCLAWVATQLGEQKFYSYMQAFGIGRPTGIDLAGEVPGRLKVPGDGDWYPGDLGTNAFGQGVAATPIQMITAVASLANQGHRMAPRIVRSVVNNDATGQRSFQYDLGSQPINFPIKEDTARIITELLARSLENQASDALVTGYRVAGKTGTAEIPTPFGYTSNETNASFVGWGPVDDPHFIVYVWLERPKSSPWGSVVAAPVFSEAVQKLVVLMNLPPDDIRLQMAGQADKR